MVHNVSELLQAYNEKIAGNRTGDDQKFLVFSTRRHNIFQQSQLVGGLADRLKGVVAVLLMAAITGRRFVIDWPAPIDISNNLRPSKYDWRYINARKFIQAYDNVRHFDLVDRSEIIDDIPGELLEGALFKNDPVVLININSPRVVFFIKYLERKYNLKQSYNLLFTAAFQFLFDFIEHPEFEESRQEFDALRAKSDMMVGVHLRTGDGNGWRDPVLDDWQNYGKVLDFAFDLAKQEGAQNPGFYFISDSINARKAVNQANWPHPVMCDEFNASHLDRTDAGSDFDHNLTYHEFQMLSKTDRLVCGAGGFASLAGLAGNVPLKRYNQPT